MAPQTPKRQISMRAKGADVVAKSDAPVSKSESVKRPSAAEAKLPATPKAEVKAAVPKEAEGDKVKSERVKGEEPREKNGESKSEKAMESSSKSAEEDIFDEEQSQSVPDSLASPDQTDAERLASALQERELKHVLYTCTFDQLSVAEFFDLYLSDDAELPLATFHASRGDSELDCASWASVEGGSSCGRSSSARRWLRRLVRTARGA